LERQRVFVYGELMRNLPNLHKIEADNFLGASATAPLYVMLHASTQHREPGLPTTETMVSSGDLLELSDDDLELIDTFEGHPEFFARRTIRLSDGSEAVVYDLVRQRLYTMHRVTDFDDWMNAMKTFDATWLIGPNVPRRIRKSR
jgi:gamma-glutamylcyclotransferase (GGCT)/AIG2-like uncharacterized protein YtfP